MHRDGYAAPQIRTASTRSRSRHSLGWGAVVGLSLMVGGATLTFAHPPREMGPGGEGMHMIHGGMMRALDKVGATAAQKEQIKNIWQPVRPQLKALRDQHRGLHDQMRTALAGATVDAAAVEQLRKQMVQLFDKESQLTTQAFVASAQVLTPEQRKQLGEQMKAGPGGPGHGPDEP